MFNFGNFELRRLIKDFVNMSEEMQKISLESSNIARNQHELKYAENLNRLSSIGVSKNVSFLGFDNSDNPEYFLEICDLIFKVNSGHRDIFTKLWSAVEDNPTSSINLIIENSRLYCNLLRKDCRDAYNRAIECSPPLKFYEVDIEELVRMKDMIEENSRILIQIDKSLSEAQNMGSMNMKKQVYSNLIKFLE